MYLYKRLVSACVPAPLPLMSLGCLIAFQAELPGASLVPSTEQTYKTEYLIFLLKNSLKMWFIVRKTNLFYTLVFCFQLADFLQSLSESQREERRLRQNQTEHDQRSGFHIPPSAVLLSLPSLTSKPAPPLPRFSADVSAFLPAS